jgi:predicted metal-binding protein
MDKKIRKIRLDPTEAEVQADLERYRDKAFEMGASHAAIIKVDQIPVDDRVTLKCRVPRCFGYGVSANCPPNALKPSELREHLANFRWAVFFTKDVAPEVIVRDRDTIKERVAVYKDIYTIVSELESMAFYDGHYFAFGLGAGSCRHTFCGQEKTCLALQGERCRFSLIARPSMEAVGIDVYRMVATAGWDIYPIGSGTKPAMIPKGTLAGIVIVR